MAWVVGDDSIGKARSALLLLSGFVIYIGTLSLLTARPMELVASWSSISVLYYLVILHDPLLVAKLLKRTRTAITAVLVLGILFVPLLLFLAKEYLVLDDVSSLYRREYVTLVAMDTAITQHFFIFFGYSLVAVGIASVGGVLTPKHTTIDYLLSWVTLGKVNGGSELTSLVLGIYGMIGIALITSLVIATYGSVRSEFRRTDEDLAKYGLSQLDQNSREEILDQLGVDDRDNLEEYAAVLSMWPDEAKTNRAKDLVSSELDRLIENGYLGEPVLATLWTAIRTQKVSHLFGFVNVFESVEG